MSVFAGVKLGYVRARTHTHTHTMETSREQVSAAQCPCVCVCMAVFVAVEKSQVICEHAHGDVRRTSERSAAPVQIDL